MLTFRETVAAIKALDTETDIIRRACFQVLMPANTCNDPPFIAREILMKYNGRENRHPEILLEALGLALSSQLALACKPGHEKAAFTDVVKLIEKSFYEALEIVKQAKQQLSK